MSATDPYRLLVRQPSLPLDPVIRWVVSRTQPPYDRAVSRERPTIRCFVDKWYARTQGSVY